MQVQLAVWMQHFSFSLDTGSANTNLLIIITRLGMFVYNEGAYKAAQEGVEEGSYADLYTTSASREISRDV